MNKQNFVGTELNETFLKELKAFTKSGQYFSAWNFITHQQNLKAWPHGEARRIAANLANNLGSSRLGGVLDYLNFRTEPKNDRWFFRNLFLRMELFGYLPIIKDIKNRLAVQSNMDVVIKADLLALLGSIYGSYRDTDRALELADEAYSLKGQDSWHSVLKSKTFEEADRYEEALEEALIAVDLKKNYRPAILQLSRCYTLLHNDENAIHILKEAHQTSENAAYCIQLQSFYSEQNSWKEGLHALDEVERLSPLKDKNFCDWITSRRAEFHYQARNFTTFVEFAKDASPFYKKIAKNIENCDPSKYKRKSLDVGFIRQHDMTCAPATMASIAKYWGFDYDQHLIAEAICYGGTPWHKERIWCEENGFITKEFRVTKENTKALIDRGIPFTLTTSWVGGAHLQACIGYDELANTALIRDPTHRHYAEFDFDELNKSHPIEGPRGMVFVPKEKEHLLENLFFHSSEIYDQYHKLQIARDDHNLTKAIEAVSTMRVIDPKHPLISRAELSLASYQADKEKQYQISKTITQKFADSQKLAWQHLLILQKTDRNKQQSSFLKKQISKEFVDASFYAEYGYLLAADSRTFDEGDYFLRKADRLKRLNSNTLSYLAWTSWKQGNHDYSRELRRFASCLSIQSESYAEAYFSIAKSTKKREEGFEYLEKRVALLGEKESGSWMTLIDAYSSSARKKEALDLIERGLEKFKTDGYFLIFAAWKFFYLGNIDKAQQLFGQSEGHVTEPYRLREAAQFSNLIGKRELAKQYWDLYLKIDPVNHEAHKAIAYYIYETESEQKAIQYYKNISDKHPYSYALKIAYSDWIKEHDPSKAIDSLKEASELASEDTWILREISIHYRDNGELDSAIEYAQKAIEIDETRPESYSILADSLKDLGKLDSAINNYKKSITIDIDYYYAVHALMDLASNKEEAISYLHYIEHEMDRQVSNGDIVSVYYQYAAKYLNAEDVKKRLNSFCEERPDLLETWIAAKNHALDSNNLIEATQIGENIVEKFPLDALAWSELADIDQQCGKIDEQITHLEQAVNISPTWIKASYLLAQAYERQGNLNEAIKVLKKLIQDNPKVSGPYLSLAKIYWKSGKQQESLQTISRCVDFSPEYHSAWEFLTKKSLEVDTTETLKETIEKSLNNFPGKEQTWNIAADVYYSTGEKKKALDVLDRGLELHPRSIDLHDYKAFYMAKANRFHEALSFIESSVFKDNLPRTLQGRRAYIRYQLNEINAALDEMQALTEKYPDYAFAHEYYTTWLSEKDNHKETRKAALNWIIADPGSAIAWGHLGQAEGELGNIHECKKATNRAFALDPSYTYAARKVFTWSLESKDFDTAENVLRQIQYYSEPASGCVGDIELLLSKKEFEKADEKLIELLQRDDLYISILKYVENLYKSSSRGDVFTKVLRKEVESGNIKSGSPIMAYFWNATAVLSQARKLKKLPYEQDLKLEAWDFFINWVSGLNEPETAKKFVKSDTILKENTYLWGRVGWLLVSIDPSQAITWLSDYENKDNVQGWMLYNLAIALASKKRLKEAHKVHQYCLQYLPPDNSTACHRLIDAYHYAIAGKHKRSEELLSISEPDLQGTTELGIAALTKILNTNENSRIDEIWDLFIDANPQALDGSFLEPYVRNTKQVLKSRNLRLKNATQSIVGKIKSSPISIWTIIVVIYFIMRILTRSNSE